MFRQKQSLTTQSRLTAEEATRACQACASTEARARRRFPLHGTAERCIIHERWHTASSKPSIGLPAVVVTGMLAFFANWVKISGQWLAPQTCRKQCAVTSDLRQRPWPTYRMGRLALFMSSAAWPRAHGDALRANLSCTKTSSMQDHEPWLNWNSNTHQPHKP